MIYTDLHQRTAEWIQMRCGCVTASRLCDVMAKLKKRPDEAAAKTNYRNELIAERLTGRAADHYVSMYMDEGTENEPLARAAYEMALNVEVQQIGLATHPRIEWFAASPDALVNDDGLLEIKCLKTTNHLEIVRTGIVPAEFKWQMLGEMSCAERSWCDFISYDPKLPPGLRLYVKRFDRDEASIAEMEQEVEKFLAEVEAVVTELSKGIPEEDLTEKLEESVKALE